MQAENTVKRIQANENICRKKKKRSLINKTRISEAMLKQRKLLVVFVGKNALFHIFYRHNRVRSVKLRT